MTDADRIINDLKLFTGTEQWYKNPLFQQFLYTDGIKYLAEKAGAYWLIDFVFSNQSILKVKEQEFQVWKLIVKNNKASIRVEDGNDFLIKVFKIDYTDFPLSEISLWFSNCHLSIKLYQRFALKVYHYKDKKRTQVLSLACCWADRPNNTLPAFLSR